VSHGTLQCEGNTFQNFENQLPSDETSFRKKEIPCPSFMEFFLTENFFSDKVQKLKTATALEQG
jgi:hypothetical protein